MARTGRPIGSGVRPPADRFFEKVKKADSCWLWLGAKLPAGYGKFGLGPNKAGWVLAHRWVYEHFVGSIPDGHELHHRCENKACVNPEHIMSITRANHNKTGAHAKYLRHVQPFAQGAL